MGKRFADNKFRVLANPFGTVYNPISIFRLLECAIDRASPFEEHFVKTQDLWAHYDFHSRFACEDRHQLEHNLRSSMEDAHQFLKTADCVIITFGTAVVYENKQSGRIVANCHKVPAREFTRSILNPQQIGEAFSGFLEKLSAINKSVRLILTVSPVRHVKDTLEVNSVSKSVLRLACDTFVRQYSNMSYFPSYEVMMDDLRDYRFYTSDMIHPTEAAEEYIWSKFTAAWFDDETNALLRKWSAVRKAMDHRAFNPTSDGHQKFIRQTIQRVLELSDKFDVTSELDHLRSQLIS